MNNKNHLSNEEIYEALMESERTLRQVIDLVPNLIFAKDKNGKFILVNKAVAKVYGKKVEDLIDRHEGDFTRYEEESRHFRKDDLEVINSGKAKFIPEETITDYRGNLRYIQTTKIPFLAGQKPAILGVSVDITDIKQIQNRLETSRNFLNRIINTVPDPIFVKDENHKWIILNDAFCEFMGYSREELIGKSDYDFFPEHEAKVFWDKDDLVFKNDIEDENEEYFTDSSGNLHVILTKKAVLKDSMTGKKILVGVIRDITDRKKSENDLYAEKEQLSVTLESIGDCVITTDAEGNIALMNRVAENLTGWSHEEASLLPIEKIFNIINQKNLHISTNPVDEVIKSLKIFEFPIHTLLITRNNMEKIITGSAAPILDKKGHLIGIVIVFRDITEKHKMEEELLKVQKLESIGLLGGGIAHDFNNFLTSILNNISLAKLSIEPQEKNFKILGEAEKVCLKAKNLTQQILTFARGGAPIKKLCSMEDLLKNSVSFPLSGSSITCEFSVSPELWSVEIDEGQINQAFYNIIINATQSMSYRGIIKIKCENIIIEKDSFLPLKDGKYIKIHIHDEGTGIDGKNITKIFDPYFTTKEDARGLGLTTAYSIIKNHDGFITVESKPAIGTDVIIYLPAADMELEKEETCETFSGKGKILLMDDDEFIRECTGEILKHLGYEVEVTTDGEKAVEIYRKALEMGNPFDAIILDLTIPGGIGGKDTIDKIRDLNPSVKAIVSSGYYNDPVMADYKKYGFADVVPKPYSIQQLSKTLYKLFNN